MAATATTYGELVMDEYSRPVFLVPDDVARRACAMKRETWTEYHGMGAGHSRYFTPDDDPEVYATLKAAVAAAGGCHVAVVGADAHAAGTRSFAHPYPEDWRELRDQWSDGFVSHYVMIDTGRGPGWQVAG